VQHFTGLQLSAFSRSPFALSELFVVVYFSPSRVQWTQSNHQCHSITLTMSIVWSTYKTSPVNQTMKLHKWAFCHSAFCSLMPCFSCSVCHVGHWNYFLVKICSHSFSTSVECLLVHYLSHVPIYKYWSSESVLYKCLCNDQHTVKPRYIELG